MAEKEYKPLDKNKDYLRLLRLLQKESELGADGRIPETKAAFTKKYGAKQMQQFYSSLPKSAMPMPDGRYYEVPTIDRMRQQGDEPIKHQWVLREPTQNNNKGGLTKKTKGYTRGGLTKSGHNDMRKGGLFR
jgi:hypothetical protein|tara:strand:+ start:42 stop:437 length:396 start_codon:yes stop_codon:yes gene_type:complete